MKGLLGKDNIQQGPQMNGFGLITYYSLEIHIIHLLRSGNMLKAHKDELGTDLTLKEL